MIQASDLLQLLTDENHWAGMLRSCSTIPFPNATNFVHIQLPVTHTSHTPQPNNISSQFSFSLGSFAETKDPSKKTSSLTYPQTLPFTYISISTSTSPLPQTLPPRFPLRLHHIYKSGFPCRSSRCRARKKIFQEKNTSNLGISMDVFHHMYKS